MAIPVSIIGTGSYLPGEPVPADAIDSVLGHIDGLPERVATRAKRIGRAILSRTGVRHRYYALDPDTRTQTETNASIAEKAIRAALAAADAPADSIDLLIIAGPMADYACPPTSAILQGQLGIETCTEIEIHSNCTGTPKAIQIAIDMLGSGRYRRAAIVYAQLSSVFLRSEFYNPDRVSFENLALRWIMSDGAGALILDRDDDGIALIDAHVESIGGNEAPGMQGFLHGAFAHNVPVKDKHVLPTLHKSGDHHIMQDIARVSKIAPVHLIDGLARMLARAGIEGEAVAHFALGIPGRHFVT